ncbi:hypothetical protein D6829_01715 [Candidatus Pacearchaeota archaeon]|nr:MAG: hypothetical protein D6829_01715 [Candidatus Pacearchaeota archaeon]
MLIIKEVKMVSPLVGLHAFLGEIGIVLFIWVFVEMLSPNKERAIRAKKVACWGLLMFVLSWIVGGIYYVNTYGPDIKPKIKAGPQKWAHGIFMETKEHIFLFLPFLAFVTFFMLNNFEKDLSKGKREDVRKGVLLLSGLIVALGFLIALMGYLISSGFRTALEVMG